MLDGLPEDPTRRGDAVAATPATLQLTDANDGWYPTVNGLTRLRGTLLGPRRRPRRRRASQLGEELDAAGALDAGLVTFAPDDIDWDDEVRLAIEERNSFSPDALTGMEANFRFPGPETMESKIFARLSAWQNWIFQRPNAIGDDGALRRFGIRRDPTSTEQGSEMHDVDYDALIPNNVDLAERPAPAARARVVAAEVRRVVEGDGPGRRSRTTTSTCAPRSRSSRTAGRTSVTCKMPDYRWGIFLADAEPDRRIGFGDHLGEPVWQEVPGELRADLRRLIVTQGDTEPASVEQQRALGLTAPSLYDLRNLFQVNVEEGRHLWAMVYLLHRYFGRDGRDEADELLERHSGDPDNPRILGAFNEPIADWLSFFFFTYFTDRDGKYQLASLARERVRSRSRARATSCSRKRRTTCSSARAGSAASRSAPSSS